MSVRNKLILLVSFLLVGITIIGAIAIYSSESWKKDMYKVGEDRIPALTSLSNLNKERMVIRAQTLNVYVFENNYSANANFADIASQRAKSWEIIDESWDNFVNLPRGSDKGIQIVAKLQEEYNEWRKIYVSLDGIIAKLATNTSPSIQKELFEEYRKTVAIMVPISNIFGTTMDELVVTNLNTTNKMIHESEYHSDLAVYVTIIAFIILIITSITLAYNIISNILKSINLFQTGLFGFFAYLNRENTQAELIALDSKDEFGQMAILVNKNISLIQKHMEEDDKFITDTQTVMNRVANGWFSQYIEANSLNPALIQLKTTINLGLDNLKARFITINSILEEYTNQDYRKKLVINDIESGGVFDTLVKDVNKLQDTITQMLIDNKQNGLTLDASSDILLANVDKLNQSSNEAAASLEETAAALEQMTSNIRSNTENIAKMSSLASGVTSSAKNGEILANQTTVAMEEINSQITAINEAISVIDQIAFQTNILSLNAAVEAATAGEAGKGFAVVAGEVRNLASRSAEAAKEIKDIVQRATSKANEGKSIANDMIKGYSELNQNISHTITLISDIEHASKEQLEGIEQINDAVT
ncbi:MAG: methyl-accepting chemotaxis protein, partial [Arcobacteraceae bacterium]|nr:methyl-accepting chemotaxis protein [Arcobacteraceae bacterium]